MNNTMRKRGNSMIKFLKKMMLLVLLLEIDNGVAFAQDPERDSFFHGTTDQLHGTYILAEDVVLSDAFNIWNGAPLTIYTTDEYGSHTITIPNNYSSNRMFYAGPGVTLTFKGTENSPIIIDGGVKYNEPYNAVSGVESKITETRMLRAAGNLIVENAILQNGSFESGACILSEGSGTVSLQNVTIRGFRSIYGPALGTNGADSHDILYDNVKISGCYAYGNFSGTNMNYGGVIRTSGGDKCHLTLKGCEILNNKSEGYGGAVYWNACGSSNAIVTITDNTRIHGNEAILCGGALFVETKMDLQSAMIYDNESKKGAGIYLATYNGGSSSYNGEAPSIIIKDGIKIFNNTATEIGGGLLLNIRKSNNVGYNGSTVLPNIQFSIQMTGGEITGNSAPSGAGIAVEDMAPKYHKKDSSTTSAEYQRTISLFGGKICNNISTTGSGAGIYIRKYKDTSGSAITDYDIDGAGTLSVTIDGALICGNQSQNGNGGGICITDEYTDYTSFCNVSIKGASRIYANYSKGHGAGLCLSKADNDKSECDAEITGGEIGCEVFNYSYTSFNEYKEIVTIDKNNIDGANTSGNDSQNSDGGGIYLDGSSIRISDGKVKNNFASGNGGGLYVNKGDAVIDGGEVSYNIAKNGAGVFMNSGEATIINGYIQYNEASANGGGLYVADNSQIGFTNGTFTNNSAKNGGGIYVAQGGTLTMTGTSNITGNHTDDASGQGGGVYMDGTMNVSGTELNVSGNYQGTDNSRKNNVYLPGNDDYITLGEGGLSGEAKLGFTAAGEIPAPVFKACDTEHLSELESLYVSIRDGIGSIKDDAGVYHVFRTPVAIDGYESNYIYLIKAWNAPVAGTAIDPTKFGNINTPELLAQYMVYVNGLDGQATHPAQAGTLTADIDMSGYYWVPIGTGVDGNVFSGTFNGNGHTVKGLNCISYDRYSDLGLFGKTSNAQIHDVFVVVESITSIDDNCSLGLVNANMNGGKIENCEGSGSIAALGTGCTMGGLVGTASGSTKIVNSMAMAEMKGGSTMGGLVGEMASGTLENSFANPKFSEAHGHVGGLVGENAGTVSNCYARLRGDAPSGFGYLAGSNSGTVRLSYFPTGGTAIGSGTAGTGLDTYSATGAYTYGDLGGNVLSDGTTYLLDKLNANAASATGYATWTRTSGSAINGDYPILKLGYESACSADGIVLQYGSLDQSLARLTSGDVLLYGSASCTRSKPAGVNLYIDEDASLVSSSDALDAYVGVTLKSPEGKWYWHQFSTPLSATPIGIHYEDATTQYGIWDEPAAISFTADGYIPAGTDPANVDFYCFYEPEYHWINFKRNSNSHWHQDGYNGQIHYDNESVMPKGKGYLLALGKTTYVQNHGSLTAGDVEARVTASGEHLTGYNLLGNPYPSYLDFDAFAEANDGILSSGKYANSYLIFDEAENAYLTYTAGASKRAATASRYIHPHQGFYIQVSESGSARFTNGMRTAAPEGGSSYRGARRDYPLVNLFVADGEGKRDVLVIELDRPELSGARKMAELKNGEGSIYARSEGNDYSILFAKGHVTEQPVRFHADSEGEFTLSWDTQNGVFTYLHLIDNLDGTDTDCLACDGYRFSATPGDYESRFRLVMQYEATEYGIGEHDCTAASSFAYISDGELVISNEGRANLQVIDMTGRIIRNQQVEGDCRISTDGMAAGVYVISLNGNVQKIVVK